MRNPILIFIASAMFTLTVHAQSTNEITYSQFNAGGGNHLQIVGEESETLVDAMFTEFSQTKRNGYIWKFKKVTIPGIEEPVTLQVHQGLYGTRGTTESKCGNETYFHTFDNEKYKQKILSQQKDTEQKAVLIYIKRGRNYNVASRKEAEQIKSYLNSLM